jgi:hypothetical protein
MAAVLTFRASREELLGLGRPELIAGLLCTWVVGMGRYWDNPRAEFLQHLGVGSVVYVIALALFLTLVLRPMSKEVSYSKILTFVTLTSPPAMLYAIPVEQFMTLKAAQLTNVWFLATVAVWRVALLVSYIRKALLLSWARTIVVTLVPLMLIVASLALLNLEHVVFRIMGGLADSDRSANDGAYMVVLLLTWLSVFGAIPVLIFYPTCCAQRCGFHWLGDRRKVLVQFVVEFLGQACPSREL